MMMKKVTTIALSTVFAAGLLLVSGMDVSAQGRSGWAHEKNRIRKEQKQWEKDQKRAQKQAERQYRLYRNGSYYQTDYRGAELLRQAVQEGYRQGYRQGVNDRRYGRNSYYGSNIYRNGTYGYQSYVDRGQYQYYFQQGFQRGYQDGVNSQVRYGYRSNNTMNILGTILNGILNMRQY
jgi:flagellar biosynthesis/type III secretory pathway protein FliH